MWTALTCLRLRTIIFFRTYYMSKQITTTPPMLEASIHPWKVSSMDGLQNFYSPAGVLLSLFWVFVQALYKLQAKHPLFISVNYIMVQNPNNDVFTHSIMVLLWCQTDTDATPRYPSSFIRVSISFFSHCDFGDGLFYRWGRNPQHTASITVHINFTCMYTVLKYSTVHVTCCTVLLPNELNIHRDKANLNNGE